MPWARLGRCPLRSGIAALSIGDEKFSPTDATPHQVRFWVAVLGGPSKHGVSSLRYLPMQCLPDLGGQR